MDPLLAEVARSEQQRTQRPVVSSSSPFPVPPGETRAQVQPIPGKYRLWRPSCRAVFLLPFAKKKIKKIHSLFRVCLFGGVCGGGGVNILFFFVISSMQKCWKHNTKNSVIPPLRCASYLQFAQFGLLFIYGNILLPELIENKVLIPYPCAPK